MNLALQSLQTRKKLVQKPFVFSSEEEKKKWRRRRRLILSKIPECLSKRIVKVSFASKKEDFEKAFTLLYECYHAAGLVPDLPEQIFFTPYQALPKSRVCLARNIKTGQVTSTGTLVLDSELGLPSDCIYKDLLDELRSQGRRLAEITCLAAKTDVHSRNGIFYVFRLLYRYAAAKGATDLVISINPKHSEFYELILLFKRYGPLRYYSNLVDAPAYLERLILPNLSQRYEEVYSDFQEGRIVVDFFFKRTLREDIEELPKVRNFTPEIFRYFFLERTEQFQSLPSQFQEFFVDHFGLSEFDKKIAATAA